MTTKKTVIIGASDNPERYSYKAAIALQIHKHPVIPVGLRSGDIDGMTVFTDKPKVEDVDTVSIYVNPEHQQAWYEYILSLKPKRVLFNPGAENPEFQNVLIDNDIDAQEACTLVMLSLGNY